MRIPEDPKMEAGMKGKRKDKRADIVEAAAELFNRFGIRRVTVEEICRKAGTSKMTFYKHFDNKIDVFMHIWNELIDEAYRWLDEIDAKPIPFRQKLERIIEYKLSIMSRMSPEFTDELLDGVPGIAPFMDELRQRSFMLFFQFVERAQQRGDMREMRPELFLAWLEKMGEIAQDGRLRSLYGDQMQFVRELNDFLFYGLLPRSSGGAE